MSTNDARELFLIMEALTAFSAKLKDAKRLEEAYEVDDLWIALEDQWDKLPAKTRHSAVAGYQRPVGLAGPERRPVEYQVHPGARKDNPPLRRMSGDGFSVGDRVQVRGLGDGVVRSVERASAASGGRVEGYVVEVGGKRHHVRGRDLT